jgi:hypothetical protein
MRHHWFCRGVVITVVVVGYRELAGLVMTIEVTYILMACSKYPPPPEVVIKG